MGRFQSKEDYERWRAEQRGEAPRAAAAEPLADGGADSGGAYSSDADSSDADSGEQIYDGPATGSAEQVYDGPAPGSQAFVDRSRKQAGLSTDKDRNMAMLCHLTALSGFFIPFGNIFGPLIIWMIGKSDSQFVDEHGKSSLNFQISITLGLILAAVFGLFLGPLIVILFVVFGLVAIYALVMIIVNGVKAHNGEDGEYALSTHFLK